MATPSDLQSFPDIESISQKACDDIVTLSAESIRSRGVFRVSLAGGSTPKRLYQLMAARASEFDWDNIELYWGDERNVPADHEDSNYRMVREAMIDQVSIPSGNVYQVPVDPGNPARTASEYDATLRSSFGSDTLDWDLVLLGMGDDAHTASLFPGTKALDTTGRVFVENWVEKFDAFRLTLTAEAINSARNIWFMIGGVGKREAIEKVWSDHRNPNLYPSQLIAPEAGNLRWMVTEDLVV